MDLNAIFYKSEISPGCSCLSFFFSANSILEFGVLLSFLQEECRLQSQHIVWSQGCTQNSPNIPNICIENTRIRWFRGGMLTAQLSCCLVCRTHTLTHTHANSLSHVFQMSLFYIFLVDFNLIYITASSHHVHAFKTLVVLPHCSR